MPDVLKEKLHKLLENQVVIKSQKILMDVNASSGGTGIISSNTTLQLRRRILLDQNFDLKSVGLGGLQEQYDKIYRQVIVPHLMVAKGIEVKCPRGILLHGPPGTGKTVLAYKISCHLSDLEAKIIKGPEIFKKTMGESKRAVREIFEDARKDFKEHGKKSKIHVILFDELDSIAWIDGPDSLDNILVIGTTNRIDLIDPAILRPGRFELLIKMHLPSIQERLEILRLHVSSMIQHPSSSTDINFEEIVRETAGYSGADLEALVRNALTRAFLRDPENLIVTMEDFQFALSDAKPSNQLKPTRKNKKIDLPEHRNSYQTLKRLVEEWQHSMCCSIRILLEGSRGTGKSFMATSIRLTNEFDVVEIITPDDFINLSELQQRERILKSWRRALGCPLSLIIIDDIERFVDNNSQGVSNALKTCLKIKIPKDHKHMVIATTSDLDLLKSVKLEEEFQKTLNVPKLTSEGAVKVMGQLFSIPSEECSRLVTDLAIDSAPISIKDLIRILELANKATKQDGTSTSSSVTDIDTASRIGKLMLKVV
ncbi:vesicle-fusing ATPase-like isoform X2 [Hibiscus syriacus]|uniref:vesicle-fusing ATPase-like isoform X2 n=1 Tax=Hibiscus syriacus TaxID=106335 RepID=UPI0019209DDB|nr:vesicle-fusing ATPase-like isoform X2 [Hibiscus syriacus]